VQKDSQTHEGVMLWMVRLPRAPVNKSKYCTIATINVAATYIQNKTRSAPTSHGPQAGTP